VACPETINLFCKAPLLIKEFFIYEVQLIRGGKRAGLEISEKLKPILFCSKFI